jgi:hypothetical protein
MPRKTFAPGEVLAAADVNTFLMDQSVMTFADSAARGSAIPSPTEGMVTYLDDTKAIEVFNGTSFTGVGGGGAATTNAIINGAFEINQRSFSSSTAAGFGFDRWNNSLSGDGTTTFSSQPFTPGSAPEAYVEGTNHFRIVTTGQTGTNAFSRFEQPIEDGRSFAGQNVTFSFWAKAASGTPKIAIELFRSYGTGGSPSTGDNLTVGQIELTGGTAWTRYSITYAMPSLSGKTFGTTPNTSFVTVRFFVSAGSDFNARTGSMGIQSNTFDIWGVQVEAGSTATPFRRNANSLQGELAACQRYYYRASASATEAFSYFAFGVASSTTVVKAIVQPKVSMRTPPGSAEFGGTIIATTGDGNNFTITGVTVDAASREYPAFNFTVASGLTTNRPYNIRANDSSTAFVGFSAEL